MTDRRTLVTVGVACCALFAVDRLTKELARAYLSDDPGGAIAVTHDLLYLRWAGNSAGFWGFLDGVPPGARPAVFLAATVVFLALVGYLVFAAAKQGKRDEMLALVLVLAGALGNGYDRLVYGEVNDCMYLMVGESFRTYLNLADLSILAGVLWVFRLSLLPKRPPAAPAEE